MEIHRFEVRLSEALFQELRRVAELHRRSINQELIVALEAWLKSSGGPPRPFLAEM